MADRSLHQKNASLQKISVPSKRDLPTFSKTNEQKVFFRWVAGCLTKFGIVSDSYLLTKAEWKAISNVGFMKRPPQIREIDRLVADYEKLCQRTNSILAHTRVLLMDEQVTSTTSVSFGFPGFQKFHIGKYSVFDPMRLINPCTMNAYTPQDWEGIMTAESIGKEIMQTAADTTELFDLGLIDKAKELSFFDQLDLLYRLKLTEYVHNNHNCMSEGDHIAWNVICDNYDDETNVAHFKRNDAALFIINRIQMEDLQKSWGKKETYWLLELQPFVEFLGNELEIRLELLAHMDSIINNWMASHGHRSRRRRLAMDRLQGCLACERRALVDAVYCYSTFVDNPHDPSKWMFGGEGIPCDKTENATGSGDEAGDVAHSGGSQRSQRRVTIKEAGEEEEEEEAEEGAADDDEVSETLPPMPRNEQRRTTYHELSMKIMALSDMPIKASTESSIFDRPKNADGAGAGKASSTDGDSHDTHVPNRRASRLASLASAVHRRETAGTINTTASTASAQNQPHILPRSVRKVDDVLAGLDLEDDDGVVSDDGEDPSSERSDLYEDLDDVAEESHAAAEAQRRAAETEERHRSLQRNGPEVIVGFDIKEAT